MTSREKSKMNNGDTVTMRGVGMVSECPSWGHEMGCYLVSKGPPAYREKSRGKTDVMKPPGKTQVMASLVWTG